MVPVPWHVAKSSKCPPSKPWAVIKNQTGEVVACHASKADAQAQVAALYANEPGAAMSASADCGCAERSDAEHLQTRAVDNSAWDGGAAMSHCSNSATPSFCFKAICAARVSAEPADVQAGWALPHHKTPGSPPNAKGVASALGYLDRTQGIDKAAARAHLEAHSKSIQAQSNSLTIPQEVRDRRAAATQRQPTLVPAGAARSVGFPSAFQVRMVERDGKQLYHLHGTATAYEQLYEMWDAFGPYKEGVRRGAGAVSLAKPPDVAFLVNHKGVTMARTTNGTLQLAEIDPGLDYDAFVNPQRQDVRDLVTAVQDGLLTESSFAFMITHGSWNDDFTEYWIESYDIDRGDVSAVNYGANPYTSVAARSREILADLDQLPLGAARAALQRLQLRPDLEPVIPPTASQSGGRSVALVQHMLLAEQL